MMTYLICKLPILSITNIGFWCGNSESNTIHV